MSASPQRVQVLHLPRPDLCVWRPSQNPLTPEKHHLQLADIALMDGCLETGPAAACGGGRAGQGVMDALITKSNRC